MQLFEILMALKHLKTQHPYLWDFSENKTHNPHPGHIHDEDRCKMVR